jgi:hypothetical protein
MLKNIYISGVVILILVGNLIILQNTLFKGIKPATGVLGAFELVLPPTTPTDKQSVKNTTDSGASIQKNQIAKDVTVELVGNGCTENVFPNSCIVISSKINPVVLKECKDENLTKCSFYTYSLGKQEGDTQYILQTYIEKEDILVDVLSYNLKNGLVAEIKTVLYQNGQNLSVEVQKSNEDYAQSIAQYSQI